MTKIDPEDLKRGRDALMAGRSGAGDLALVLTNGAGALVWDNNGNEYIDCTSQAWSLNTGYSHPKVVAAATEQIQKLTHVRSCFDTVPQLILSKKLSELAPGIGNSKLKKVTYCLHGSLAVEGAMKLALKNRVGRKNFISLYDAYHGRSFATIAISWPHPNNKFLPYAGNVVRVPQAYCYRCPFNLKYPGCDLECVKFTEQTIKKAIDGKPVAFLMEPIQGNGGMIDFPKEYYKAIRKLCTKYDILLIWDEIQTAFGRIGEMFAAELYETVPDIIVFGKSIGGGFPLAGTLSRDDLQPFQSGEHAFTFGHFPVSMAAALANLKAIEEENLLKRAKKLGQYITTRLDELKQKYELIGDVRGPGLMIGFELVKDRKTKRPACQEVEVFIKEGMKRGVIFGGSKYGGLGNVVKIKPPLVITEGEVEKVLKTVKEITEKISNGR